MEKKKQQTGRMSDPQGFFFFSYLQELSLVLQVSESEFYQWAALVHLKGQQVFEQ